MNLDQMISTLTGAAVSPTKTNATPQTTQAISARAQTDASQKRGQRTDLNGINKLNNKKNVQPKTQYGDNHFNRLYLNGAATNKTSSKIYDSSLSSDSECDRRLRSSSEDEDNIRTAATSTTAATTASTPSTKAASTAAAAANSRRRNVSPTKKKPAAAAKASPETRPTEKKKRRPGKSLFQLIVTSVAQYQ